MIILKEVTREDRNLLWSVNQKYLYEMTQYYPDDMDPEGNYHYGHFEEYFTDPERSAYLIYEDQTLVGFALLNPYSYLQRSVDMVMAEFTIFPSYRRRHLARTAAQMLLDRYPGKWEIKYNRKNTTAEKLWTSLAGPYVPEAVDLGEEGIVLAFSVLTNRKTEVE